MIRFPTGLVFFATLLAASAVVSDDHSPPGATRAGSADASMVAVNTPVPMLRPAESEFEKTLRLKSTVLGRERTLLVHLPESYETSNRSYPVHVVLDGEFLFRIVAAHVEFLSEARVIDMLMPETIVVGVVNEIRDWDYSPSSGTQEEAEMFPDAGGAATFLKFLGDELLPAIDRSFRTNGFRLLTGWSFSGLFAVYVMGERPELFNVYHGISPSIWWDGDLVIEALRTTVFDRPTWLFTSIGSIEVDGWTYEANKRLATWLSEHPKVNLAFNHIEIAEVGHHLGIPHSIDRALRTIYKDYLAPDEIIALGPEAVSAYYNQLSQVYGYRVDVPFRVYEALGEQYLAEGQDPTRAIAVLTDCVAIYPDYPMAHRLLGIAYRRADASDRATEFLEKALRIETGRVFPDRANMLLFRRDLEALQADSRQPPS